jgi:uroporphyrinogen decarboxylase
MKLPDSKDWWHDFWKENNGCLYGAQHRLDNRDPGAAVLDSLPVRPAFTTERPHVPVLVELGEDWIIDRCGADYRRYILDHDYQQATRERCTALLLDEIGFRLKPKVDTSSLLHGSVYGNPIEYPEGSTPWLGHFLRTPEDIRRLIARMQTENLSRAGLVPEFVRRWRKLGRAYAWRILHDPSSVHGPGTILGFLFGINEFALLLYDQPGLMHELLDCIGRVTVEYSRTLRRLTGAPERGVGIFDDVAGLVSSEHFREFFMPVYRTIYGELAPGADDDRFLHNDARVEQLLPFFGELGVNGINPDPETPPQRIRAALPDAVIHGCIPPLLLKDGSPDQVFDAARRSITDIGRDGGLVLTTAGSINMGTPPENLKAMCFAAQSLGRFPS